MAANPVRHSYTTIVAEPPSNARISPGRGKAAVLSAGERRPGLTFQAVVHGTHSIHLSGTLEHRDTVTRALVQHGFTVPARPADELADPCDPTQGWVVVECGYDSDTLPMVRIETEQTQSIAALAAPYGYQVFSDGTIVS
jgi:hypothetical protein